MLAAAGGVCALSYQPLYFRSLLSLLTLFLRSLCLLPLPLCLLSLCLRRRCAHQQLHQCWFGGLLIACRLHI